VLISGKAYMIWKVLSLALLKTNDKNGLDGNSVKIIYSHGGIKPFGGRLNKIWVIGIFDRKIGNSFTDEGTFYSQFWFFPASDETGILSSGLPI